MPRKLSRRLAGWLVIELLGAAGLAAADFEYKAGIAQAGRVQALALEDRRGHLAVIAQAGFTIPRAVSDVAAAQVMKNHNLERGDVLMRSRARGDGDARELVAAMEAALANPEPARVLFNGSLTSITGSDGTCRAVLGRGGSLAFRGCAGGRPVRGAIRSAFQMVEPAHGLLERRSVPPMYSVQALAIGNAFVILSLGGDNGSPPNTPEVEAAIRRVLARVR